MKTILTSDQMKKLYGVKIRKPMNSDKADQNKKLNIQEATDIVLIEVEGKKHQFPSWNAYNKLLRDHENLKSEMQKMFTEMRTLREALRAVGRNVDYVEGELRNKIDKP